MNLRSLLLALALTLMAAFAVLNWPAFTAPTELTLGFATVQAPLGLVMLVVTALLCGLFMVYIIFQQAGVILEARRYAKEIKANRELADTAEASRFTEMRSFIEAELRKLEAQSAAGTREVGARIDKVQQQLLDKLAESTLSLSAIIGEVEDKFDRAVGPAGGTRL